tara:strand:+ start:279 stop:404 length:126 start_codon:yes stop_codon:yes gene_type:complete
MADAVKTEEKKATKKKKVVAPVQVYGKNSEKSTRGTLDRTP